MRITDRQQQILDSFICERLSENPENETLMKTFESTRGKTLVSYCNNLGFQQDRSGEVAYYIIKTQDGMPLMFFSLKCGSLFEIVLDEDSIIENKQKLLVLLQAIINVTNDDEEAENAIEVLISSGINNPDEVLAVIENFRNKKEYLKMITKDKRTESNTNINRVDQTHSGIELMHFCTNENAKSKWHSFGMNRPMGETLFWYYISKKFFEAQQIVGCKYAYLFAADLSEDGTLLNYYDVSLKFKSKLDVGTNKPVYDFGCVFLCQEINSMKDAREEYFDSYNIDVDEDVV